MTTATPLDGPFMTSRHLTDYSGIPGYAIEVALSEGCCSTAVAWTLARLERKQQR